MAAPSGNFSSTDIAYGLFILALPVLINIIVIGSAIWVYLDAKKYKNAGVPIVSPEGWGALTFLVWIICFPLYLILKFTKYEKMRGAMPTNPTPPATPAPPAPPTPQP